MTSSKLNSYFAGRRSEALPNIITRLILFSSVERVGL